MTSEAIEESGVNVFMSALVLGSGTARRFESNPTDANEPIDIGKLKPGKRTAILRFQHQRLLFLYPAIRAMRQRTAASHFVRVCAGSLTKLACHSRGWSEAPDRMTRDTFWVVVTERLQKGTIGNCNN